MITLEEHNATFQEDPRIVWAGRLPRRDPLPPDRVFLEAHIEDKLFSILERSGRHPQRQVRCEAGIIDLLTDSAIYEVKLWLDRTSIVRAVGQLTLYAAAVGDRRKYIVGQETPSTLALVPLLGRVGIGVALWDGNRFERAHA